MNDISARARKAADKIGRGLCGFANNAEADEHIKRTIDEIEAIIITELAVPPAIAGEAIARHPEDYCHKCSGPNISWYAPSLLWNQFVRDKGEPEIICPICFAQLANEANVTWSMVPDTVTSDYDERLAVRAAQRIINATLQCEEEAMVIVRDALVQSAAALRSRQASQPAELQAAISELLSRIHKARETLDADGHSGGDDDRDLNLIELQALRVQEAASSQPAADKGE